jgi:hypothetical protein
MLRSRRLETLLGAPVADLTAGHMHAAVEAKIAESHDLDWKGEAYGNSDKDKRELAADVAALANTVGGLIVLGVAEDGHACASAAPGVRLSDAYRNQLLQVIASSVAPVPRFEVRMVADGGDGGHGFVLIAVERSGAAPHAVVVGTNLRYPRREGTITRYLSEPEVADAYRARLAGRAGIEERLRVVWADGISRLDVVNRPYACLALVPDVPGSMTINRDVFDAFRAKWVGRNPNLFLVGMQAYRVTVGQGRLTADGSNQMNSPTADWLAIDTYTEGAGFFAVHAGNPRASAGSTSSTIEHEQLVEDELLANGVLTALVELAAHAEAAMASGTALVLAGVHGIAPARPTYLGHARRGFGDAYNETALVQLPEPVAGALPLEVLAGGGRPVVALASRLCDQIAQAFGVPELGQLSADGLIRAPYFAGIQNPNIKQRIEAAGFEITSDV